MPRSTKTIALAMAILTLAAAAAVNASVGVMGKGLKFGVNSTDLKGAGADPGLTPKTGFAAGVFLTLGSVGGLSLQPEILYAQKGAESESGAKPCEYDYSYVQIPVLLKLTIVDRSAAFRPNMYAGPFVGLNIGAIKETYLDPRQEESVEENIPAVREIDAGYALGAGADLILGPGRALLDIRYERSLTSAITTGADVMHRAISVSLGYSFD